MIYYTQLEICCILLDWKTATELMDVRELLEETGHFIGSVAFDVYDSMMKLHLTNEKIWAMAIPSEHRTNAFINLNFIIRVLENPKDNTKTRLTSANKLSKFVQDEELKERLFEKVLSGGKDRYVFKIRERLRIDFVSK